MAEYPISLGGNFYLKPLDENTNKLAYTYNFINIREVEPSLGVPTGGTHAADDTLYYFPIITVASAYIDSRRYSNKNETLTYYNNNIGVGTATPNHKLSISGSLSASKKLIIGLDHNNNTEYSSILGGVLNTASGEYTSIVGGSNNQVDSSEYSYIGAGFLNQISHSNNSSILGGTQNAVLSSTTSNVNGGGHNLIQESTTSNINGGDFNRICISSCSNIAGGYENDILGHYASNVNGGSENFLSAKYSSINSGRYNCIINSSDYSSIVGGNSNLITGVFGESTFNLIGGGARNILQTGAYFSSIIGGHCNTASSAYSIIGGGFSNNVSSNYGVIGGGVLNSSSGYASSVLNGICNSVNGCESSIIGGQCNVLTGNQSAIIGGSCNSLLSSNNSFILGSNIQVTEINDTTFIQQLSVINAITSPLLIKENIIVEKNILVYGSVSALSGFTNVNTVIASTSTLNVNNFGIGPALTVRQDGNYSIAEYTNNQSTPTFYIGNTPTNPLDGTTSYLGVNTNTPNVEFTVNGSISSNKVIYVSGGDSNLWNQSSQKAVTSIGDNTNTQFEYYHNFNSQDLITQVYDNNNLNVVYPLVTYTSLSSVKISFANIPTTNQYRVIVRY
jgi:hypothetical protein